MTLLLHWLKAFALTQVIEAPLYAHALGAWTPAPLSLPRRVTLALFASLSTHPAVWFIFPTLFADPQDYWAMIAVAETFVVLTEAAFLWALRVRRALIVSLVVNTLSFLTGLLYYLILGRL